MTVQPYRFSALAGLLGAMVLYPCAGRAQIRASEIGTISQIVDGTRIAVQYSRPRARGRTPLFGGHVVTWGEVWTPGANWATTLEVSKDVKVNGHPLKAGKYSVWMVVRDSADWTVVLDTNSHVFHMRPPDSSLTQVRFPVRPREAPFAEVLTFTIPDVRVNGATLAMQWGTKLVPMDIEVQPSFALTIPDADARHYVGSYDFREKIPGDTGKRSTFIVTYENGTLKGEWNPEDNYMKRFALIRVAPDWFAPGLYDESGRLYEVLRPDLVFQFTVVNGRATAVEMRNARDILEGGGARKN